MWGTGHMGDMGWQAGHQDTDRGGDALQLAQGHFVVHAADIPPHVIVLRHRDLHRVGMAVTILLPTLGVAWGQGAGLGQEGLLTHNLHGLLPWEPSVASGALRVGSSRSWGSLGLGIGVPQ